MLYSQAHRWHRFDRYTQIFSRKSVNAIRWRHLTNLHCLSPYHSERLQGSP